MNRVVTCLSSTWRHLGQFLKPTGIVWFQPKVMYCLANSMPTSRMHMFQLVNSVNLEFQLKMLGPCLLIIVTAVLKLLVSLHERHTADLPTSKA
jgi:hypothetical protein